MAVDPATILGSWDEVLFIPTNSTVGALTTGVGECHTHPHSSNLLTDGWLQSYYGNQWGVEFVGNGYIDCGSGATLDDLGAGGAIMQVEGWFLSSATALQTIVAKGNRSTSGWGAYLDGSGYMRFEANLAGGTIYAQYTANTSNSKWHHFVGHYNDTTKVASVAVDGVWGTNSAVGAGAYISDAALNLRIGEHSGGANPLTGSVGWINIYNNAFYTPGTNFKPPRTPTAADVEEWLLNEGTGGTATAQVTSPANDGTITAGTWQPQWYAEGTPIVPTSVQGSASYRANVGSGATIDDLADNAMTVEGWFRAPKLAGLQYLCHKGTPDTNGWYLALNGGVLYGIVSCATSPANSYSTARYDDNRWHYIKATFDDAGDRKIDLFIDNVEVTYGTQTAGVGAIVSDAAGDGSIGRSTGSSSLTGAHGWIRWSNVVRGAGMISRATPPAVDGNTVAQWDTNEGAGATLTDSSGNANHGAMAGTYTWINTGAMDVDSPGARVYGWGNVYGTVTGTYSGMQETFSGTSVGADYVVRALGYSEDGVGVPILQIWDETSNALITRVSGSATSTEWSPDMLLCSFELPNLAHSGTANCNVFSTQLMNAVPGSNVGWHQCELYRNLLDNPSLDMGFGDPWIPYGWTNNGLDAGDSEIETVIRHSEGASWQANIGADAEYIYCQIVLAQNKFAAVGGFLLASGVDITQYILSSSLIQHATLATAFEAFGANAVAWLHKKAVTRCGAANPFVVITHLNTATAQRYVDDLYAIALDDVTLTVTPASQASSLEGTGIRVDGLDRLTQPVTSLQAGKGKITFQYTPRHSAATVALIGNATPVICSLYADANNYILLDWSAANTIRLRYNAGGAGVQTGTWDATGLIVAGTLYNMEIRYTSSGMKLYVDGNPMISISAGVGFSVVPTTAYWGSDNSYTQQNDFVIS